MRGIVDAAAAVPHWSLARSEISKFLGSGGGKGNRSVASYDEDAVTLAVQAGRRISASIRANITDLSFATTSPVYLERSHASIVHAALGAPRTVRSNDLAGLRSGIAGLMAALETNHGTSLVLSGDLRGGLAGGADEAAGGDAGAAIAIADDSTTPLLATVEASASVTAEFIDRWRTPGSLETRMWEERFGEQQSTAVGNEALCAVLQQAGIEAGALNAVLISNVHTRVPATVTKALPPEVTSALSSPTGTLGFTGATDVLIGLVAWLESANPGDTIAVVNIADGADAIILKATAALATWSPTRALRDQIATQASVYYARYLSWRGVLPVQPPNRPEPARVSAPAAQRRLNWKYELIGSQDSSSGAMHFPPARVSWQGGSVDDMEPVAMADAVGTVATFTVDRLAWSPSPPVIFAVVDFDGGGRVPIELTDCAPEDVAVGSRVELTFRKINSADGLVNYFWKGRPLSSIGS